MEEIKTDRRVKYTKKILRESLLSLMERKPLEKITVMELCEAADVNRGTFYKYYQDVSDLLGRIEDELLKEIVTSIDKSLGTESLYNMLLKIFILIKNNKDICKLLVNDSNNDEMLKKLVYSAHDKTMQDWKRQFPQINPDKAEYLYDYVANGSIGIIRRWINGGFSESVQDMTEIIEKATKINFKNFA